MGIQVNRAEFTEDDYARFEVRLHQNLDRLKALLESGALCERTHTLGAEVELVIVDRQGRPLPLNRTLLAESLDDHWALELDRFNLEYNLSPVAAAGRPFAAMQGELDRALAAVERSAQAHGGNIRMVGILPTLTEADMHSHAMTDLPRYQALSAGLRRNRQAPFEILIDGAEPLRTTSDDVTFEGANTSFQVHMRVAADRFAPLFNALQLATPVALAVSTNAPFFAGRSLWEETRIALFKQSVDERLLDPVRPRKPPRVCFGNGWVRQGAWELFAQAVALHPVLLPICDERTRAQDATPQLGELRLHAGTVWSWNRPVYDPAAGGHLRIEARALPAGPTSRDMMASAAFMLGLAQGLSADIHAWIDLMPFSHATWNFYRAAQHGMDAVVRWPDRYRMRDISARKLAEALLPVAERGLGELGVDDEERSDLLALIAGRLDNGQTGARWMRAHLSDLEGSLDREQALRALVKRYGELSGSGEPVHTWPR